MGVAIRSLHTAAEMAAVNTLFQQVWGSPEAVVHVDLLQAVAHAGGYVVGAFDGDDEHLVGASFGFRGVHAEQPSLHSHVTGILPGVQHTGVGRAIKEHQRAWAVERDIAWITWTFDPLVRRNAWFNISVLGAQVHEYLVDFYGPMHDNINADDQSDRLLAAWPARDSAPPATAVGRLAEVPTPDDVVVLRRTDPSAAEQWRLRVRTELGEQLAHGARVVEFTRDGNYVLELA